MSHSDFEDVSTKLAELRTQTADSKRKLRSELSVNPLDNQVVQGRTPQFGGLESNDIQMPDIQEIISASHISLVSHYNVSTQFTGSSFANKSNT